VTSPLTLVIDTNVVLDAFVFDDEHAKPLRADLEAGALRWLATAPMREELRRVLDYPHLGAKMAFYRLEAAGVLGRFDAHTQIVDVPAKAPVTCKDPDDQKFIDLAVAHRCLLLSKDKAVTSMTRRLAKLDAPIRARYALPIG
jgi:predicted nucleic acid-binding protein